MSNSSGKIHLVEYINSFSWDQRIVLLISKDIHFINETDFFLMIRRPPRSTRKESSAASDVYKRQVLLISKDIHLINETDYFFKINSCENEARNLKYIRIVGNDINKYTIPDRFKNKYGLWLIGYDGGDKSYSNDTSLLKEIHNIIDTMPIRKSEMTEQNEKCN